MKKLPFTNVHIHVFTTKCAPDSFLKIIPNRLLRKYPKTLKKIIDKNAVRKLIVMLDRMAKWGNIGSHQRKSLHKYLSFLEEGTKRTQQEVFMSPYELYHSEYSDVQLIGLSLNMDYMDNKLLPPVRFNTQLEELKSIKKEYPDNFFPFVCADPRAYAGEQLVNWIKKYFEKGIRSPKSGSVRPYFSGIKLYPALGFFPFDPRLDELYAYAEENGIPIMTHCTRVGSLYVGDNIESLIPRKVEMIEPNSNHATFEEVKKEIHKRIEKYYEVKWIKNNTKGANDMACDLFGHPQNYVPIMLKYPKLKICLAHMGGDDQIDLMNSTLEEIKNKKARKIIENDGYNWASLTKQLMIDYPSLYTDISYTLYRLNDSDFTNKIKDWLDSKDEKGNSLSDRVLFGTDFYMTEQENQESALLEKAKVHLGDYMEQMSRINPDRYLNY
ncbi:amidohydrolase family protein [Flammeovirga sp. OC4]|uniref:amidohydrolase family protein n=1 Tax=Flammeovirga sp. OC4 TaxID=1382345 RepID=UPI0005C4A6C5|nr:amidohydrolase family protein [Flammeovirga sp. OC4]